MCICVIVSFLSSHCYLSHIQLSVTDLGDIISVVRAKNVDPNSQNIIFAQVKHGSHQSVQFLIAGNQLLKKLAAGPTFPYYSYMVSPTTSCDIIIASIIVPISNNFKGPSVITEQRFGSTRNEHHSLLIS